MVTRTRYYPLALALMALAVGRALLMLVRYLLDSAP